MRLLPFVLAATLGVCGCAAHTSRADAPPAMASAAATSAGMDAALDGTAWRFVRVAGVSVPADVTATLRLRNGRASGKAGCNAYGAAYHIAADGSASFQQSLSTKMACLQPAGAMRVERGVFDALRDTARVKREGNRLTLLDASGKPLAALVQAGSSIG